MNDKLGELIKTLDTATGMLVVSAIKDGTVKQAMELVMEVSLQLGDIINEGRGR